MFSVFGLAFELARNSGFVGPTEGPGALPEGHIKTNENLIKIALILYFIIGEGSNC